jgi:hypothetical protein
VHHTTAIRSSSWIRSIRIRRPGADRGPCAGDRRHVLNTTVVLNTPTFASRRMNAIAGGWQVSGLFQALSGGPLNVTIGRDQALTGAQNQRPNINGDWQVANPTNDMFFNTAAFSLPAPGNVWKSRT